MKVLKVELQGLTTSFRYPHFLVGRQPTYRMPPPATIYGHICSAVGEWLPPESIKFGYCFYYAGRGNDLEHIHVITVSQGKFDKKWGFLKNIQAEINPLLREIIILPKLILYIDSPNMLNKLFDAFCSPYYPVILGRSQDLATYKYPKIIQLEKTSQGYFENTLLPWSYRTKTIAGVSVLMPRFINPEDRGQVEWERYVILEHRVFYGIAQEQGVKTMVKYEGDEALWIDPDTPEIKGMKRAIVWHTFTGEKPDGADIVGLK